MTAIAFNDLNVGDEIPSLTSKPITRTTLGLFAGASGDHNPIHIDIDFAKAAGVPDVFAHGMLSMAYLAKILTGWVPQTQLRSYGVRFGSITNLQDEITCKGTITEKFEQDGEQCVRLQLSASNQSEDVKLMGEAVIALS